MISGTNEKVDVISFNGKLRRCKRAGGFVSIDIRVHQSVTLMTRDLVARRDVGLSRTCTERITDDFPSAIVIAFKVRNQNVVRIGFA